MTGIYGKICGYALYENKDKEKKVRVCIVEDYDKSFGTMANCNIVLDQKNFLSGSEKDILNKTVLITGSEFNGVFYGKTCKEL